MNETFVPAHIAPVGFAAMLTLTGKSGLTVIVIELDVAGEPVAQVAFEVITQLTILLFASDVELYDVPPVPTFVPFTFHW